MADLRPTVRCHDSGGPARLLQEDRGPGAAGQEDPGVQGAAWGYQPLPLDDVGSHTEEVAEVVAEVAMATTDLHQ